MKKKLLVTLMTVLVVLSIGQAALASSNVGLTAGYGFGGAFAVEAYGEYQFSDLFSLYGGAKSYIVSGGGLVYADVAAKFNIYGNNTFNVGALLDVSIMGIIAGGNVFFPGIFVGPGVYADVNIFEKINLYAKINCIVVLIPLMSGGSFDFGFDISHIAVGASYQITDNISVGIKGSTELLQMFSIGANVEYRF